MQAAIRDRALVLPWAEHGGDRAPQLLGGVLREGRALLALHGLLVELDDLLPVLGPELGVGGEPVEVLVVVENVLEHAVVDAEHHARVHLDEAPVAVVGEAFVAGALREAFHRGVVEPEVEDRVHHARHGGPRARAHETSSGLSMPPNTAPTASPIVRSAASTSGLRSSGSLPVRVIGGADLGGDREAEGHRQAEARHLGEIGALAAEKVGQLRRAVGAPVAEQIDELARLAALRDAMVLAPHRARGSGCPGRRGWP